ncbi:DDE-type integrase/transposase/recombinase [Pararhodobacter oceanensis]|nr:DDE-type integrase/transposase/recombinase [Pararhodobacter oceanensis]
MKLNVNPEFPVGCLIVDGTKASKVVAIVKDSAVLRPVSADANAMQDFLMSTAEIREHAKRVDFEIKFSTSAYMQGSGLVDPKDVPFVAFDEEEKMRAIFGAACCMALEELRNEGLIRITAPSIDENHDLVSKRTQEVFRRFLGVTRRGNRKHVGFDVPYGQTLVKQYNAYTHEAFDPSDFWTKHSKAGRKKKTFDQWVMDLMAEAYSPYRDQREPKLIRCYERLQGMLLDANRERLATVPGFEPVKVSERKFREYAANQKPTAVKVSRKGQHESARLNRCGIGEIAARMIGESVEIDECELPLWVFLEKTGMHKVFGPETMRQLKLEAQDPKKGKVWVLVAVDVATGMPLAFHLAKSQNADDSIELLRRLVSDKTKLAQDAGCKNPPPPPVRPYMVTMDTGSGLWNNSVPRAILSLGGWFRYGRTKSATDKAFVERFFATLGSDIVKALHGYNGQGPGTKTEYDGQDMTVMMTCPPWVPHS